MLNIARVFCSPRATLTSVFLILAIQSYTQYNSLLWRVSGNGLQQPSFLYGTMHVSDARVFQFSDSVMPAFERCGLYAMEIDFNDVRPMELLSKMMAGGNKSIRKSLAPEDYRLLDSVFRAGNRGIPLRLFDNMSPVLLEMMMGMQTLGLSDSSIEGNTEALDIYFNNLAKKQNKKIVGIETVAEQINALNSLSYQEQLEMLQLSINDLKYGTENNSYLISYYVQQQLDSLLTRSKEQGMPPKFFKALVTERNKRMADRMEKTMKDQSAFMAVGALHLAGNEGVVALLRKKGFMVEPIR